jgi:hypothetical protein
LRPQVHSSPLSLLAPSFSRLLPPAAVLLVIIVAAAAKAGLSALGIAAIALGTIVLPGIVYKSLPWIAGSLKIPPKFKTATVSSLIVIGTTLVVLLRVPHPVVGTLASLILGNIMLAGARVWLNASAHVSVLTFGVLWWVLEFGPAFACLLVLPPLMVYSRTSLRQHTLTQAVVGATIGVATFGAYLGISVWSGTY